ncbi:MAG TPA: tRNA pseudouridine(55) synthase TruB [Tepidisphaeraceae bacterium]|nr:tRNA pseudouridine(55) synthase TruB [Tepidisphaeraceae bacterium]
MANVTAINGVINLDKPAGISSAAAVGRVKWLLARGTKIGHAGTLDPFATGILLLLIGKATKTCETFMGQPKQYETTVKLGATTATDDPDSPEIPTPDAARPSREEIERATAGLVGMIQQRPPAFSALKVGGRRAYELARRGKSVELQPRNVRIDAIGILSWHWPLLRLRIDCGRGTYIRAIARDLGEELKTGGYLTELRRTRIGSFGVAQAVTLDQLEQQGIEKHLQPISALDAQDPQQGR